MISLELDAQFFRVSLTGSIRPDSPKDEPNKECRVQHETLAQRTTGEDGVDLIIIGRYLQSASIDDVVVS